MYGIYLHGELMEKFNTPLEAYKAAQFAFLETGVFHAVQKLDTTPVSYEIGLGVEYGGVKLERENGRHYLRLANEHTTDEIEISESLFEQMRREFVEHD